MDDVFEVLDRTESTLGQHALYHRLRTSTSTDHLPAFEALVGCMHESGVREPAQLALSRLGDPHGYDLWWLAREDSVQVEWWYVLFPLLTASTVAMVGLAIIWPQLIPALVGAIAISIIARYLTDERVGAIARAFRQIAPVIATCEALRQVHAPGAEPLVGSLEADTASLRPLKTLARWISGDPFMLPATAGPVAIVLNDVVSAIYEYVNLIFLLDANGVYFGARRLHSGRARLLRIMMAAGEIDAAISVASVRAQRDDWTRPRVLDPGETSVLSSLRHPLLSEAIPNSVVLPAGRGAIITGSNMSGKSTFLRTVGVSAVLAQTVNTCFASEYSAPVFDVRSCIGRSDDLLTGTSYYIAEVRSLLELVEASAGSKPCLFLLDELFRGTNAVERIAAGQAVLRELVGSYGTETSQPSKTHVALVATHDLELVDLLADRYTPHHFGDSLEADRLVFDHTLRPGATSTRNAIALLRLHGAPDRLIESALAAAAALDVQRGSPHLRR